MFTRRALGAGLASAPFFAAQIGAAFAASDVPVQMNLSGVYGLRVQTAQRRAFHLHNQPADSTLHRALTTLWTSVFERTNGALMVTVLPLDANLPLSDAEAVYNVAAGRFEFVSVAAPILDALVPDIGIQTLPFVYSSVDQVLEVTDQPKFKQLLEPQLARAGLVFLAGGTFSNGFRLVASIQSKPIRKLSDLDGLKIRVPPSVDMSEIFRTLGAVPVEKPIAEMRPAFVAGEVEAEENPPAIIAAFDLQSVTHWINVTNHAWSGFNTLANRNFWTSLPPEVSETVLALLPGVRDQQVAQQEAVNAEFLRSGGMEVIATDISGAQALMQPVYSSMLAKFSPEAKELAKGLIESAGR